VDGSGRRRGRGDGDRDAGEGAAGAARVWAIATGRFRAAAVAAAATLALAAAATLVTGLGAWATYADLLRDLGGQLTTPHNFAPGAVAHMAGASEALATAIQLASAALAVAALLVAWRYASPSSACRSRSWPASSSHRRCATTTPCCSCYRRPGSSGAGRTWAVVFPLAGWIALFAGDAWLPAASVSVTFFACLAVLLWEAALERRGARATAAAA